MARLRVCAQPGCPELGEGRRCDKHASAYEQVRGRRQARGYDRAHELLREHWLPKVEACTVDCSADVCLMPVRLILPGQQWHLDHTDDRTSYRGPSHALCNTSAGGKASHAG